MDQSQPLAGLSPRLGLFATPEWWSNIANGKIHTREIRGKITALWHEGQDSNNGPNTIEIITEKGEIFSDGVEFDSKAARRNCFTGAKVAMTYAVCERKDGSHVDRLIEIALL